MKLFRITLAATLFTLAGFVSQAVAQSCLAVSVRGGVFSCPGCLSPGAMPLQCSVHQCSSPAPAVDGWLPFSSGFADFAGRGAVCATLGVPGWAAFLPPPPPTPPALPVVPVVTPPTPGPTIAPGPVITTGPTAPRVLIGTTPASKTTVVVSKRPPIHQKTTTTLVHNKPTTKVHSKKTNQAYSKTTQQGVVAVNKKKYVNRY